VLVKAVSDVRARFLRRLNQELETVDTAEVRDPRENNVAKLFNRSKLVKSRLVQELSSQVAQLSFFVVSWVN